MHRSAEPETAADFESAASALLPPEIWDFVAGGSGAETTLAANRAALDRVFLVPRVLQDVSSCSTRSTLLGRPVELPVAAAPVAYQRLFHPDGERATSRAAASAGIPFTVSTLSSVPIEQVVEAGGSVWFQLYWLRDDAATLDLVRRAEAAGCEAIVLTVDVPWMGRRLRDIRNRFALPAHVRAANIATTATAHERAGAASAVATHTSQEFASRLTWAALARLRAHTDLPVVIKGLLAPEDAERAVDHGVNAIVVSNHGGRQLDAAVAGADALPDIIEAVRGRCEVLLDSGIRSGTDVLRALALGASGVLLGRPLIWGLAVGGERGAIRVLRLLETELHDAMGLAGCENVAAARRLRTSRLPATHSARGGEPLPGPVQAGTSY
ncbi:alpha-hydroxy acid oxidase [Actinoplanes regularis]|uniref:4-hydroxymandelate oxidase n=1 Tax=Actinoplanes regularis TaxID=52697 RepID=A0A239IMX6_9ACTN|nr:alpha-hydroxy acid oxidase [Actinoplanes regularis]GIE91441.1 alpha-hydroxy-acid oxidizing enzyme [Actinoplanes regularis]SNS94937.1 4-hydroxymandelate oxidase [Actinoplanes regularis]